MSERYATLVKGNDGRDVVSNISLMQGTTPEIRKDSAAKVVKVADGVKIGMVKGGKHGSVGGYGWDDPLDAAEIEDKRSPADQNVEKERATVSGAKK